MILSATKIKDFKGCRRLYYLKYIEGLTPKTDTVALKEGKSYILPNLIVDNDEIDASHSAYIGKFDDKVIFYLMTRGLSEKESNNSIAEANVVNFNQNIVGQIAQNDRFDMYSIKLKKNATVTLNITSYMQYYCLKIYDSYGNELWYTDNNEWNPASQTKKGSHVFEFSVKLEKSTTKFTY